MSIEELVRAELDCRGNSKLRSLLRDAIEYVLDSSIYVSSNYVLSPPDIRGLMDSFEVEVGLSRPPNHVNSEKVTLQSLRVRMLKEDHTINKFLTWENEKYIKVTSQESIIINKFSYPRLVFTYLVDEKRLVVTRRTEER